MYPSSRPPNLLVCSRAANLAPLPFPPITPGRRTSHDTMASAAARDGTTNLAMAHLMANITRTHHPAGDTGVTPHRPAESSPSPNQSGSRTKSSAWNIKHSRIEIGLDSCPLPPLALCAPHESGRIQFFVALLTFPFGVSSFTFHVLRFTFNVLWRIDTNRGRSCSGPSCSTAAAEFFAAALSERSHPPAHPYLCEPTCPFA